MKSKITEKEPTKRDEFPVLMKSVETGEVFLFTAPDCAVCVNLGGKKNSKLGVQYDTAIDIEDLHWERFTGSVTLSND